MNERLHEELAYCVPLGIPHSRFLSWSPDDQDKALAYTAEVRTVCTGCGTRPADWAQDKNAFIGWQDICQGCLRIEEERANVREGAKGVRVMLLPGAEVRRRMEEGTSGIA